MAGDTEDDQTLLIIDCPFCRNLELPCGGVIYTWNISEHYDEWLSYM